jgi:hypothetical protein
MLPAKGFRSWIHCKNACFGIFGSHIPVGHFFPTVVVVATRNDSIDSPSGFIITWHHRFWEMPVGS